jgi:hypothetical protein
MTNKEGYRRAVRILKWCFLVRNGYVKALPTYFHMYIASFVTYIIKAKIPTLLLVTQIHDIARTVK